LIGGEGMKLYVHEHGIVLVGKAWEIREKLKEYREQYYYLNQLLVSSSPVNDVKKNKVIPFPTKQ
jgi:hypothetical protein